MSYERHSLTESDFRTDIVRADKGRAFVRVIHIPSKKERIQVGLDGIDPDDVAKRLTQELRQELGL
jgi:hypothetical protein